MRLPARAYPDRAFSVINAGQAGDRHIVAGDDRITAVIDNRDAIEIYIGRIITTTAVQRQRMTIGHPDAIVDIERIIAIAGIDRDIRCIGNAT